MKYVRPNYPPIIHAKKRTFVYINLYIGDKYVEKSTFLGISAYLYTLVYTNIFHKNNHFLAQ